MKSSSTSSRGSIEVDRRRAGPCDLRLAGVKGLLCICWERRSLPSRGATTSGTPPRPPEPIAESLQAASLLLGDAREVVTVVAVIAAEEPESDEESDQLCKEVWSAARAVDRLADSTPDGAGGRPIWRPGGGSPGGTAGADAVLLLVPQSGIVASGAEQLIATTPALSGCGRCIATWRCRSSRATTLRAAGLGRGSRSMWPGLCTGGFCWGSALPPMRRIRLGTPGGRAGPDAVAV